MHPMEGSGSFHAVSALEKSTPVVLLVDDRPANLLALEALLEALPVRTLRANSGEEALRILLKQDVAVVLLDVQMPGMDGFETAAQMRSHTRISSVPIIFITAISRDPTHVYKGYERGAVDYIMKPFDPVVLKAKVSVFVDLFVKAETIKVQAKLLREQELAALDRKMERRYRRLADAMPLFVWGVRPDGTVDYVNEAWMVYSGLAAEETAEVVCAQAVHADDLESARTAFRKAVSDRAPFEMEYRLRRRDGAYRWHLVRSSVERGEHGAIEGFVVSATDIDAAKETEAQRERLLAHEQIARQAAEDANRTKDEFIASVSHELRNPLHVILGWTGLLRTGNLDAERRDHATAVIDRSARTQAVLVEDLLDIARVASGRLSIKQERIDAAEIVRDAVESLRPAASARGVTLSFRSADVQEVYADAARLGQIVSNLLTNSMKFTSSGGHVDVEVTPTATGVRIQVKDDGDGIAAEFLPRVFERFQQETVSDDRRGGLGIGLALVKHLVEVHGGTVAAASDGPGRGAVFTVELPSHGPSSSRPSRSPHA